LGFFDGVHIGHGALLRRVVQVAEEIHAVPAALTFDTHPEQFIFHSPMSLLTTPSDRASLMRENYQIQDVIVARFDEQMMRMPWQTFVTDLLIREHGADHLVAGHDFHFGYRGQGNPERLTAICRELGIGCDIIARIDQDDITVSSTYIRTLVAQGEMERAADFLGHPHTLHAAAVRGASELSLVLPSGLLLPAKGVYSGQIHTQTQERIPVEIHIAARPNGQTAVTCLPAQPLTGPDRQTVRLTFYRRLSPQSDPLL